MIIQKQKKNVVPTNLMYVSSFACHGEWCCLHYKEIKFACLSI